MCKILVQLTCINNVGIWLYQPLEIVTYIFVGSHKQTYLSLDLIIENQGGLLFCIISKKLIKHWLFLPFGIKTRAMSALCAFFFFFTFDPLKLTNDVLCLFSSNVYSQLVCG